MKRSLALWLHLAIAERRPALRPAERQARPDGDLVWIIASSNVRQATLRQIQRVLRAARPQLSLLVTCEGDGAETIAAQSGDILTDRQPGERMGDARAFLDHWRPSACLILGNALPAAVICSLHQRAIPVLAADRTASAGVRVPFWRKGWLVALLQRFDVILAQDSESVFGLRRQAGQSLRVELGGRVEETTDPLPCNEAERADIADTLKARPVWLAVGCPEAEEEMVLAAHTHALSYAHRLLLILAPVDMSRIPALAKRLAQHGLATALRGEDQEPEPDIQVLVVEGQSELGLWYRLSPVTYMGGSLSDTGSVRSPFEPVALGSAVVHGPKTGPYPDAYALLSEARASRQVLDGPQLCSVIADLLAPDKAAQLAHSAWAAASGGAEVAERVAAALLASLDAAAGRKAR